MKKIILLVFATFVILVVLAFVGIQPMSSYKAYITDKMSFSGESLPLDVSFFKPIVYASSPDRIIVYLSLSPNSKTVLGKSYTIRVSDQSMVEIRDYNNKSFMYRVGFADLSQSTQLQVTFSGNIATGLFLSSDSGKDVAIALEQAEYARSRLESVTEQSEKVEYDYFIRGIAPSYEQAKKMDRDIKDARMAVENAESDLASLESRWRGTNEVLGISVRDIMSHLTFVVQ